jgi:hypothetical protein
MKEQCRESMLLSSVCGQCSDEGMLEANQPVPVSHAKMKFDRKRIVHVHDRAIQCLVVTANAHHVYCSRLFFYMMLWVLMRTRFARLALGMFHETRNGAAYSFLSPKFTYSDDPVSCGVKIVTWHDVGA